MRKNFKGLIALILSVVMIIGCGVFASGSHLMASTDDVYTKNTPSEAQEESAALADNSQTMHGDGQTEAEPQEIIIEVSDEEAVELLQDEESDDDEEPDDEEFEDSEASDDEESDDEESDGEEFEDSEESDGEEIEDSEASDDEEFEDDDESDDEEFEDDDETDDEEFEDDDETDDEEFEDDDETDDEEFEDDDESDDEDQDESESEDEEEEAAVSVYLYTADVPANGSRYVLGESIEYYVIVANDGDLPLTDISVIENLTGGYAQIDSLEAGESSEEIYVGEYVVTSTDIENGEVLNDVTVTANDGKGHMVSGWDEMTVYTEEANPKLTIYVTTTSEPANGAAYVLGETITYMIFAKNDGNIALNEVELVDALTDDIWNINEVLAPGQTTDEYITEYVVTEKDINKNVVINRVTGRAECGLSQDSLVVVPGEDRNPTMVGAPSLYVTQKVSSSQKRYDRGDTVTFKTTVLNNGNAQVTDIQVMDELSGQIWIIEKLDPAESKVFEAAYIVSEDDILNGKIVNLASAVGTAKDPDTAGTIEVSDSASAAAEPAAVNKTISIDCQIVDYKDNYQAGDTVQVLVTVVNKGNVTQDISVRNMMPGMLETVTCDENMDYTLAEKCIILNKVAPGESRVFTCSYEIDATYKGNSVMIAPIASNGDVEVSDLTHTTVLNVEKPADTYTLTIQYVYEDGTQAAPAYVGSFTAGTQVPEIVSPQVSGYTPEFARVISFVMPSQNLSFTITYTSAYTEPETSGEDVPERGGDAETEAETISLDDNTDDDPNGVPERDGMIEVDENGEYVLTAISDDKVPMGAKSVPDLYACMLHWTLLAVAVLAIIAYMLITKKQNAKLAKLTETIKEERKH